MGRRGYVIGLVLCLAGCAHGGAEPTGAGPPEPAEPAGAGPAELRRPILVLKSGPDIVATFGKAEISASLGVSNPNAVPIRVRWLDWKFAVGKGAYIRGRLYIERSVEPNDLEVIDLMVKLSQVDAMNVNERVRAGETRFRSEIVLQVASELGDLRLPAEHSGHFKVVVPEARFPPRGAGPGASTPEQKNAGPKQRSGPALFSDSVAGG